MDRVLQSAVQLKVTIGRTIGSRSVPRNSNSVVTVSKHYFWCEFCFSYMFSLQINVPVARATTAARGGRNNRGQGRRNNNRRR